MNEFLLDYLTDLGKLAVDSSDLKDVTKEILKIGIDFFAECEKFKIRKSLAENLQTEFERVKIASAKYDISKVVRIPVALKNGRICFLYRIYGNDIIKFANAAGVNLLDVNPNREEFSCLDEIEKEHGIIIYERTD